MSAAGRLAKRLWQTLLKDHGPKRPVVHKLLGWFFKYVPGQITCGEFEGFLVDYHEGLLQPGQRRLFERHLGMCGRCRESYRGYVRAIELGRGLFADPTAPLPEEVPAELVHAVVTALRSK